MKRIAPMMFRLVGVFAMAIAMAPLARPVQAGMTDAENANSVVSAQTAEAKESAMRGAQAKQCEEAKEKLAEARKTHVNERQREAEVKFYCSQSFTSKNARNETPTDSDVQTLDTMKTASIPGGATSNLLSGQSLGGDSPASEGFKLAEVKVDNSAVSGEAVNKLTNGNSYGVYNDSTLKSSVTGANTATTNVTSVKVDDKALDARYDPAKVVIGGSGTGMVRCSGKSAACPGGKWGVDTNDGSHMVSMNEGRTRSIVPGEWFGTGENGVTNGYLVNSSMPKGTTSAMVQTADMIRSVGEGKGYNNTVIATAIADVYRESKFDTAVGPNDPKKYSIDEMTSAWGYGQYVGDTWVRTTGANRNNSFSQATVLLDDVNARYQNYTQSSIQNRMTFGEYDYAIHHDGSIINGGAGNVGAINYYRNTAGAGNSIANYVLGGNYTGNVVAGGSVRNIFGSGVNPNAVNNAISAIGRGDINGAINSLIGGGASSGSALQLLAQALQGGGSSSSGSGSDSSGSSTGGSGSGGTGTDSDTKTVVKKTTTVGMDETMTVTRYSDGSVVTEVVKNTDAAAIASASSILSGLCGGGRTTSRDAFMLMINQCSALHGAGV